MTSGDWLPAQAPFDVVRRGYSPEQVTAHLERLEYDLRITTANRDATNQRLNELGAQLAAAQSEADHLRAQLDRSALEPVSMSNLSDRMQRMIRLAEEEAGEIKARSEAEADRLRAQLEQSLADAAQARAAFDAERERTRKQLAEQVHGLIAEATSEADETRAQAQEESSRLLKAANAEAERTVSLARQFADETVNEAHRVADQELTSAHLAAQQELNDAHRVAQEELAQARGGAEQTINEANAAAANLTSETAAERERLDAESLAHRTQVEEDFEIAITARRVDARRVITEREEASAAAAAELIADATARAEQLVANATAEAEKLMRQATTYANALVNRAAAESHQRVADADDAVLALHALRAQLTDQLDSLVGHLDHIRDLAGSAPALITPPATEEDRPQTAHFPIDPAARPTAVDLPVPVYGDESGDQELGAVDGVSSGTLGDVTGDEGDGRDPAPGAVETAGAAGVDGQATELDDASGDSDTPGDMAAANGAASESSESRGSQRIRYRGGRGR